MNLNNFHTFDLTERKIKQFTPHNRAVKKG